MVKVSQLAIIGPSCTTSFPLGAVGQTCIPMAASTSDKQPLSQ